MSYRLDVVTGSIADAVRHARGLMFDRGRAGWRVVVVTDDDAPFTALTILGTHAQSPGQLDVAPGRPDRLVRIRVQSINELTSDRFDSGVANAEVEPCAQLLLWGPPITSGTTGPLHAVRHDLSPAARTFKAHALRCVGLDTHVESSEQFWVNTVLAPDQFGDLLPVDQWPHVHGGGHHARSPSPNLVGGTPFC